MESTECRHALKEKGCLNCKGFDANNPPTDGKCRHAIQDMKCANCQGVPSILRPIQITRVRPRDQIIQAAPRKERRAIKRWRERWRSMGEVVCHWCRETFIPAECHGDHVIPLSRGGVHALSNLVIACASCNLRKHDLLPEEWAGC